MKLTTTLFLLLYFISMNHAYSEKEIPIERIEVGIMQPNEVIMKVHGIVCSFCTQGVKKKLGKLNFIDRSRLNKGILMDVENQKITVAISPGVEVDVKGMFDAVVSGGYEPISALISNNEGETRTVKAGS